MDTNAPDCTPDTDSSPIADFVKNRMNAKGLTRRDVCTRLGYSKAGKAFMKFDECMSFGAHGGPFFVRQLAAVLEVDLGLIEQAYAETANLRKQARAEEARLREEQERAAFVPHLWVNPESEIPSPIFIVAFCGVAPFRVAELPEGIAERPIEEQKAIVRQVVQQHFAAKHGCAGPFGRIMSYRYRNTYDTYWRVDTAGEFGEFVNEQPVHSCVTLAVSGKTIETGQDGLVAMFLRPSDALAGKRE